MVTINARQDEALQLAAALIDDIELSQTSTARRVMKAQRIARLTQNASAMEWISFELSGGGRSEASQDWMTRTGRWTNRTEGKGYRVSAADLESTRDSIALAIQGQSVPLNLSGDYVNIAMSEHRKSLNASVDQLNTVNKMLAKIDQQLYNFSIETYNELRFSQMQASLFENVRLSVDEELSGSTDGALLLIDGISERLGNGDNVAISQAMATCRQLIDAVADHVFPATDVPYVLSTGKSLVATKDKVKNRLNAFVDKCGVRGSRAERIGKSLNEIYARVSASVHNLDAVETHEAQYLFLGTYVLLGEIVTLPRRPQEVDAKTASEAMLDDPSVEYQEGRPV